MTRKLRMGMVGGGRGAFIGQVHRMAANLDGKIELVAGAFSSCPEKSKLSGEDFFIDSERAYPSYEEMAKAEAAREDGIDFVSIVVQNHLHFRVAKCFLEAGIHVICDKPLALDMNEAKELQKLVHESGLVFALTHNYTGYPMVKEAKRMVAEGELGRLLKVVAEYPQGYAIGDVEGNGDGAISNWRADPKIAGMSNCIGDIGTHAHHLAHYITGLEVEELAAELTAFIPGRELDDDGNCLIRFENGVKGIIYASQISNGDENNLNIRIYGTKASIEWHQEDPNELLVKFPSAPRQIYRRGNDYLGKLAQANTRTPFAHPEGFIEAFANVYLAAAAAISDKIDGKPAPEEAYDYPTVDDGVKGMAFIKACVESSKNNAAWTQLDL